MTPDAPSTSPDVSVCVVNWNGGALLTGLLESISAGRGALEVEVLVVDNASTDGSADAVASGFPWVRLIRNRENRGFARANNQAAQAARGRLLFFLNNDTLLEAETLPRLVAYLDAKPRVVAAGPRLLSLDGAPQESNGALPTLRALLHRVRLLRWTCAFRSAYQAFRHSFKDRTGPVDRIAGAALLVRRSAISAPLWDEAFPFGLEDVDLSLRLSAVGEVHHVAESQLLHHGSVSSEANSSFVYRGYEHGYARFLGKHDPRPWAEPLYRLLVTLDQPVRVLLQVLYMFGLLLRRPSDLRRAGRLLLAQLGFIATGLPAFWRAGAARPRRVASSGGAAGLIALTVVGFLLRLGAGLRAAVIARDGAAYLEQAQQFLIGNSHGALSHHYPPLYALWLSLGAHVAGALSIHLAVVMSALAGAAAIPAVALLARRPYGRSAALYAGLLAAILPLLVELGGEIIADSLYLALVAWTLVFLQHVVEGARRSSLAASAAAVCGVLAYLTRPEALAVLAAGALMLTLFPRPRPTLAWRRFSDLLWLGLPAVVGMLPFVLFIKGQPTLGGAGVGAFKLTLKQNLWGILGGLTLDRWSGDVLEMLRLWGKSLGPGLPLLLVASLGPSAHSERPGAGGRLALHLAATWCLLIGTLAIVRSDRRYVAGLLLLALPHAGWGACVLASWIAERKRSVRVGLAVALLAVTLPVSLLPAHRRKTTYRDVGAFLAERGTRRVLARDSRAGFYAHAETLPLLRYFPNGTPVSAEALRRVVRAEHPDAVVLVVDHDVGAALSKELASILKTPPTRFTRPGATTVDVFLLDAP